MDERFDDAELEAGVRRMLAAAAAGDVETVVRLASEHPSLADAAGPHPYWGGRPRPLQVAAEWGRREVTRALLDRGVEPDNRPASPDDDPANGDYPDWSPLLLALIKGHRATAALLMERGATIDPWSAALLGDADLLRRHLDETPDLVSAIGPGGGTLLHYAATAEVAELLVSRGADLRMRSRGGWTPLEATAFDRQRESAARWLLSREPEPPGVLILAALDDADALASRLQSAPDQREYRSSRVDATTTTSGVTPLHVAAALGRDRAASVLLNAGADPDSEASGGIRPLHLAAKGGHQSMAHLLVERGANPALRDDEHDGTPADWADFFGHSAVRDWLRERERTRPAT